MRRAGHGKAWQAFACFAVASSACGSPFKDAPSSDASAEVKADGPEPEGAPRDAATEADAKSEASPDGEATVCPHVKPAYCRGYLDYESACGYYEPCDCTYWEANCTTLANDVTLAFQDELAFCAALDIKKCPKVETIENCAYDAVAGANHTKLTAAQSALLAAYCTMCPSMTGTSCLNEPHPFAAEYGDTITEMITDECTGVGKTCANFMPCVAKVLGLMTLACSSSDAG